MYTQWSMYVYLGQISLQQSLGISHVLLTFVRHDLGFGLGSLLHLLVQQCI